jgi:hypothetical protein
MQLPRWVRHPYATLRDVLPTRRQVLYAAFGSRKGRAVTVLVVYGLLAGVYLSKQLPYPAVGETEGWIAYYELSSTQRGALAYGMLSGLPAYLGAQKALQLVYSPDENVLRVLDTQGNYEQTWLLGDEMFAKLTVEGGSLSSRRTKEGKVWYCIGYDPDDNVAQATWDGSLDAGQIWTTKEHVHECLTDTQDRARDADQYEREEPERIRKATEKELTNMIDNWSDLHPVIQGDGYEERLAQNLGIDGADPEAEDEARRQENERERGEDTENIITNGEKDG